MISIYYKFCVWYFWVVDIKECFNPFLPYVAGWLFNICFYNTRTLWKNPLADQKCRFILDVFIVSEDRNIYGWSSVIFIIMNNKGNWSNKYWEKLRRKGWVNFSHAFLNQLNLLWNKKQTGNTYVLQYYKWWCRFDKM